MIQTSEGDREDMKEAKLPGRDWILLPAISLMTICGILASAECIARRMFTESKTGVERCMVFNDPSTGARGLPDSVCWEKKYENEPVGCGVPAESGACIQRKWLQSRRRVRTKATKHL
jgi:hypothetical protein